MSGGSKVLLGICTFLPVFLGMSLFVIYMSMLPDLFYQALQPADPAEFMRLYFSKIFTGKVMVLFMLMIVTHISLIIYYILHAVKNVTKSEGEKIMWILLFVFIGTIPFLIYFFLKIVPMPPKNANSSIAQP